MYDSNSAILENVKKTYDEMHTKQTVDFVKSRMDKWLKFNHVEATIMESLDMLNDLVDESDPDLDLPNIVHAFQTAEQIRANHPDKEWFQLTGLIHDLGKVMNGLDSKSDSIWILDRKMSRSSRLWLSMMNLSGLLWETHFLWDVNLKTPLCMASHHSKIILT